jgi:hypothetical protein
MKKLAAMRILITLPPMLKKFLEDLKRLENRSASGYIQYLLKEDRRARLDGGWRPHNGWKHLESPKYQKYLFECGKRAEKVLNKRILQAAKRIEKKRMAPRGKGKR